MRVPRRILVPTDLSGFSLEALQYADEVARLFHAEIVLFHVLEVRNHDTDLPHGRNDDAEFEARKSIIHLLMEHSIVPQNLKLEITRGIPVDEILKSVMQHSIDLIVMSTHGRTGLHHILLGSIAEQIVRLSTVPVLTMKPEGPDENAELREEDIKTHLHLN